MYEYPFFFVVVITKTFLNDDAPPPPSPCTLPSQSLSTLSLILHLLSQSLSTLSLTSIFPHNLCWDSHSPHVPLSRSPQHAHRSLATFHLLGSVNSLAHLIFPINLSQLSRSRYLPFRNLCQLSRSLLSSFSLSIPLNSFAHLRFPSRSLSTISLAHVIFMMQSWLL